MLEAEANWAAEGWVDGPWFRAAFSIYRTAELIRQSNDDALRPLELTHVRHEALAVLYFSPAGEMPMGRLSDRLVVHPTSVTSTVDTLQRLGYVAPRAAPDRPPGDAGPHHAGGSPRRADLERRDRRRRAAASVPSTATQARSIFTILARVRGVPSTRRRP